MLCFFAPTLALPVPSSTHTDRLKNAICLRREAHAHHPKVEDALRYLEQVKIQFASSPDTYDAFLEIMKDFKSQAIDTPGVIARVRELFHGHTALILGFNTFLPPGYKIELHDIEGAGVARRRKVGRPAVRRTATDTAGRRKQPKELDQALKFVNRIKQTYTHEPATYKAWLETMHAFQTETRSVQEVYDEVSALFEDHPDLLTEFASFLPESSFSTGRVSRKRINEEADEDQQAAKRTKASGMDEIGFFHEVKQRLSPALYGDFIKVLNLYANQILSTAEVVTVVRDILGRHAVLVRWFEQFVDARAQLRKLRSVQGIEDIDEDEALDYGHLERFGPSYRALPDSYVRPRCTGRDATCKSVLNDSFVSVPATDSDDFIFKSSVKNEFEETLFRTEDHRFELDLVIAHNASAINALQPLAEKINQLKAETAQGEAAERPKFRLADSLNVLQLKAIERIYGQHARDILDGLKKNPETAIPIILKRLRQKDDEWRRAQREWNKIWNETVADNYRRSLDYQGVNFKLNDRKNTNPKTIVQTIKEKVRE